MPGYSSEEVQAAIDKFLLGTVSMPRTNLGMREVLTARDDIYALLTTTLLLRPDSYFYVIFLAKNRLEALRRAQKADLDFILADSTVAALQRRGVPVTDTTELVNAQAALLNINAGINAATGNRTRNLGPEVDRFRKSLERFVTTSLVPNVVEAGVPTETAGELRARISSLWAGVVTRHAQILELCTAIQDAVTNLSAARLPEKAIQSVVSRLETRLEEITEELEEDRALSTHREAMLELLTMRTLLSRVSAFRIPTQLLAPLTGDSSTLSGVSSLNPAAITGSISGPFNVPPAATLDFESGTPVSPSSITLVDYSNAENSSADIAYPVSFPLGASFRIRVDGVLYPAVSYSLAVYATDILFLASITAYLILNAIPATAYISGGRIIIRSNSFADISSIEVLASTAGELAFRQLTGFARYAVCQPVPAANIISKGIPYPDVRLSENRTEYGNVDGVTAAASTLDLSVVSGTLDTTGGGTTFTATINLESAGARARDSIRIGAEVRTLVSVVGAQIVLSSAIPDLGVAVAYRIGQDFTTVPVGTRVLVSSLATPLNAGPYRVVSGDVAQLIVDRAFFAVADAVSVFVVRSRLVATAPGTTPTDGITAWPASAGATAVGYVPSVTQVKADFTEFDITGAIDLFSRGVGVGDLLTIATTPTPLEAFLTSVSIDSVQADAVPYFAGAVSFTIESVRYLMWLDLVEVVQAFVSGDNFKAADFAITRVLSGASPVSLLSPSGPVGNYSTLVTSLGNIQEYVVPFERGIDNILRMLVEQGFDRSADLFTTLDIVEFFGMHPDGSSYATNLVRTAADVTRQVAPVSRFVKSIWGHPEVRLLSRRRST